MKENILILEDSSKAKFGGGQKVTLEVMEALHNNYNLVLVDCNKKSIFQEKANNFISDFIELNCNGKVVGGDKSSFGLGYFEILLFPILLIKNIFSLGRCINDSKFNNKNTIIYATTKKNILLAYALKKLFNINYIYHAHSFDDRSSFFYKIINPAYKKAKKIMCVSNLIKNNIKLNNCQTVYNPIEIINTNPKKIDNKDKIIIATFSTLIKWKGVEYFMKSFDYLENKQKVEYWIFGEGQEKEYLQQFENDKVILKGFVNNSEELMLNEIDIVVVPSITEEACPMVPLEAFKCAIPVISTNIGGQAEIVLDNKVGCFVNIKDSEAIANKIDSLIDDPDKYNKLSENAIEYSKKFDSNIYKQNILKIFKEFN
jgi:glycosyltransferase involved in cell wall biosynthesis